MGFPVKFPFPADERNKILRAIAEIALSSQALVSVSTSYRIFTWARVSTIPKTGPDLIIEKLEA